MPQIYLEKAQEPFDTADLPNGERLLDLSGIAYVLGVRPDTPSQWRYRKSLQIAEGVELTGDEIPEADHTPGGKPLWDVDTIVAWAKASGRWPRGAAHRPDRRPLAAGARSGDITE